MIYLSSDHGGFELKNRLAEYLKEKGLQVSDEGPYTLEPGDDYPDTVSPVLKKFAENNNDKAILVCRNGVGVSMTANKFKGVRAVLSWNSAHAQSSRKDDDTNVLALPSDHISEVEAFNIVETWISTPFGGEERHVRRLGKVAEIEKENFV
jgi:RpiB/LacA/LacB family sugar-phosphate isomerase